METLRFQSSYSKRTKSDLRKSSNSEFSLPDFSISALLNSDLESCECVFVYLSIYVMYYYHEFIHYQCNTRYLLGNEAILSLNKNSRIHFDGKIQICLPHFQWTNRKEIYEYAVFWNTVWNFTHQTFFFSFNIFSMMRKRAHISHPAQQSGMTACVMNAKYTFQISNMNTVWRDIFHFIIILITMVIMIIIIIFII